MSPLKWKALAEFSPPTRGLEVIHELPSDSLRPALSGGHGEEGEQGPDHIVVVKLVSPPVSSLHLFLVFPVVNVVTPQGETRENFNGFVPVLCTNWPPSFKKNRLGTFRLILQTNKRQTDKETN